MNCKNCGGELRSDAIFCTGCGTRIEAPQMQDESSQTAQIQQEQPNDQQANQQTPQNELPEQQPPQPVQAEEPRPPEEPKPPVQPLSPYHTQPQPGQFAQQSAQYQAQPVMYSQQQGQYGQQSMTGVLQSGKKKSKTGLIIGISIGGFILLCITFVIGLVIGMAVGAGLASESFSYPDYPAIVSPVPLPDILPSPQPVDTPPPPPVTTPALPPGAGSDEELIARWERIDGDYLWFFGTAEYIEFVDLSDGTFNIFLTNDDGRGSGFIIEVTGKLFVTASWGSEYEFDYTVDDELLILIDSDGDSAFYLREG